MFRRSLVWPLLWLVSCCCSVSLVFGQKAGTITRFVAPANIVQAAPRPGLQEISAAIAPNATVKWHDILRTGDGGRIRAQLNDGSILSLGSKTQLIVNK